MNYFPTKLPVESFAVSFDFSQYSTSITGATILVSVLSGTDPNPSAILFGALQIASGVIVQRINNGIAGTRYIFDVSATDGINTWADQVILEVNRIS